MVTERAMLLHAVQELTFPAYLYRVLSYLVGFGGIAVPVYSLVDLADSGRFPLVAGRDTDDVDR